MPVFLKGGEYDCPLIHRQIAKHSALWNILPNDNKKFQKLKSNIIINYQLNFIKK